MATRGRKSAASLDVPRIQLVASALPPIELPPAPLHLSASMQGWWRQVVEAYDLDPHHLKILEGACDAWDRMVQAREAVQRDGLTVPGTHGPKTHPAAGIERDSRVAFARLVRELDLDCEAPSERAGLAAAAPALEPEAMTMPFKRRLAKGPNNKITAATVALFEEGLRLRRRRNCSSEDSRAYGRACCELDHAIGLRPWMESVLDTVGLDEPPSWMDTVMEIEDWQNSAHIRRRLEDALADQRARPSLVPPTPTDAMP